MTIGYGTCVGNWRKFTKYVVPAARDRPLLGLAGQTSIAKAYNSILDAYRGTGVDALVLLHDDLQVLDPEKAEQAVLTALSADESVALVGVAGGKDCRSLAWWNHETIGHQRIDSGMLDFGPREGYVQQIEGSFMALSPWAIENLRFDTRYPGFHGYDEIAMAAWKSGRSVVVADIDTHHHTKLGFSSTESEQLWLTCNQLFREKYGL